MTTAKEEVQKILDHVPDNSTFEDIQYHIYVLEKIERGLQDIKEDHMLSQEEVEKRMSGLDQKLKAIRKAVTYNFPSGDIDKILKQIKQ